MSEDLKHDILGVMRFSYRAKSGFQATMAQEDLYVEKLYSRERLQKRLKIFKILTLRSLRAQTFQNFRLIIIVGEDFPKWALAEIKTMVSNVSTIEVILLPQMDASAAQDLVYLEKRDPDADIHTSFCLDDDDAFAIDWMEKLDQIAQNSKDFIDVFGPLLVYPRNGLVFQSLNDEPPIINVHMKMPWAIGMALVTKPNSEANVFKHGHLNMVDKFHSLAIENDIGFIRTLQNDNDSDRYAKFRLSNAVVKHEKNFDLSNVHQIL